MQGTSTNKLDAALKSMPVATILANRSIAREIGRKCPNVDFTVSVNDAVNDLANSRPAEWQAITAASVQTPARMVSDAFDTRYGTDFNMATTPFARVDPSICGYAVREAQSDRLLGLMLLP